MRRNYFFGYSFVFFVFILLWNINGIMSKENSEAMKLAEKNYMFYTYKMCENVTIDENLVMEEQKMANLYDCEINFLPKVC